MKIEAHEAMRGRDPIRLGSDWARTWFTSGLDSVSRAGQGDRRLPRTPSNFLAMEHCDQEENRGPGRRCKRP